MTIVEPVAGYSNVPLARKLGIARGKRVHLVNAPPNYRTLVSPLPEGVIFVSRLSATTDLVHLFGTSRATLASTLGQVRKAMRPDAVVWVSWPKKPAQVATDLTEDAVREIALPLGLVDVKVCAVDDVWSGLKLVVRKTLR